MSASRAHKDLMHYSVHYFSARQNNALFLGWTSDGGVAGALYFPGHNADVKSGMMHGPIFYIINAQLMLLRQNNAKNDALFVRFIPCYFS